MTRKQIAVTTVVTAVLLGACSDGSSPTGVDHATVMTGTAAFAVTTAPEFLSAIRLRVIGSGITNPVAQGTARVMARQQAGDTTTFLLSLTSTSGTMLQVGLADRTRVPRVVVLEATAGRLGGYRAFAPSTVVVTTVVR
jgi:hypothetical protein